MWRQGSDLRMDFSVRIMTDCQILTEPGELPTPSGHATQNKNKMENEYHPAKTVGRLPESHIF